MEKGNVFKIHITCIIAVIVLIAAWLIGYKSRMIVGSITDSLNGDFDTQFNYIYSQLNNEIEGCTSYVKDVAHVYDVIMNNKSQEEREAYISEQCEIHNYNLYIIEQSGEEYESAMCQSAFKANGMVINSLAYNEDRSVRGLCFACYMKDSRCVLVLEIPTTEYSEVVSGGTGIGYIPGNTFIVDSEGFIINSSKEKIENEYLKNVIDVPASEEVMDIVTSEIRVNRLIKDTSGGYVFISEELCDNLYLVYYAEETSIIRQIKYQIIIGTIVVFSLIVIMVLLIMTLLRQKKVGDKLLSDKFGDIQSISAEIRVPLQQIIKFSDFSAKESGYTDEERLYRIKDNTIRLSNMFDNLFSYANLENKKRKNTEEVTDSRVSKVTNKYRNFVFAIMILMLILYVCCCVYASARILSLKMLNESEDYIAYVDEWMEDQKDFAYQLDSYILYESDVLDNKDKYAQILSEVVRNNSQVNYAYICNPEKNLYIISSVGEVDYYDVTEREWYKGALEQAGDCYVSTLYTDSISKKYCITISKTVFDKNGEYVGVIGLDYSLDFLDVLVNDFYNKDGYVFLLDRNGFIINHPNPEYARTDTSSTYIGVIEKGFKIKFEDDVIFRDFDGIWKIGYKNAGSEEYSCVVVKNLYMIIKPIIGLFIVGAIFFIGGIAIVTRAINKILRWNEESRKNMQGLYDMAKRAGDAKTEFLARVSHELRTPINGILGMDEMILRENNREDIGEYALNIKNSGEMLLSLVNGILDFSKIEEGIMELVPVEYSIEDVINDSVTMVRERAIAKGLTFNTEIDPNLCKKLFGDDVRIKQVIINLLTNAVKYTDEGSVTFRINQLSSHREGEFINLLVEVEDTGIGIKEEDISGLFESFKRFNLERNHNVEGTGLGITICSKLLEMMDSSLNVKSTYEVGSKFSFILRQQVVDSTPIGPYKYSLLKKDGSGRAKKERCLYAPDARVLVVDDNEINRQVAAGLMRRNGIFPDLADSGQQCIEYAKKNDYHIIFLDHMMPVMDGMETIKRLKADGDFSKDTKIVVLTANAIVGAQEKYMAAGFDGYLSKPIDVEKLEETLKKYLPESVIAFRADEGITVVRKVTKKDTVPEKVSVIDREIGLKYCGNNEELYAKVLAKYKEGRVTQELKDYLDKQDINSYTIQVHALKSTSKSIGATKLSELALSHEKAAKEGNIDYLTKHLSELADMYKQVQEEIR